VRPSAFRQGRTLIVAADALRLGAHLSSKTALSNVCRDENCFTQQLLREMKRAFYARNTFPVSVSAFEITEQKRAQLSELLTLPLFPGTVTSFAWRGRRNVCQGTQSPGRGLIQGHPRYGAYVCNVRLAKLKLGFQMNQEYVRYAELYTCTRHQGEPG
jgi:hypothetical protein